MYQCKTLVNGTCTEWLEVSFLGLPPIPPEDAHALFAVVLGLFALAWGFRFVVNFLSKR